MKRLKPAVVLMLVLVVSLLLMLPPVSGQQRRFPGVTINVIGSSGHTQLNPIWEKLSTFEAQTGIKVVLTRVPLSDLRAKIQQDLRLGAGQFDILEIPDDTLPSSAPFVAPLDPLLRADGIDPEAWLKEYVPWVAPVAKMGGKEVKFHVYYSGTVFGAYRANLFTSPKEREAFKAQYGYDLPTPPRTPQQLIDVSKFFTRKTPSGELWGLIFSGKLDPGLNFFEQNLFLSGLTHLDKDFNSNWGPKHPENRETVKKIAQFIYDLIYTHKVTPLAMRGMTTSETTDFYLSGRAAMIIDTLYFSWPELNKPANISRIGRSVAFEVPAWKEGTGGIPFYWAWAISRSTRNPEAAWEFIKWVTSEENIRLALTKGRGQFVPTKLSTLKWAADRNVLPTALVAAMKKATLYPIHPANAQVREIIKKYYERLVSNQITPEQFVIGSGNEVQDFVERVMKR